MQTAGSACSVTIKNDQKRDSRALRATMAPTTREHQLCGLGLMASSSGPQKGKTFLVLQQLSTPETGPEFSCVRMTNAPNWVDEMARCAVAAVAAVRLGVVLDVHDHSAGGAAFT